MKKKKILIVGNLYPLISRITRDVEEVFVAPGDEIISKIATCVDIREDNPNELLKFALDNNIDLTIVASEKAIESDIASVFQANEMPIFGPTAQSAECVLKKSSGKKFLYKLHAKTPKFGIFDKSQLALDYIKNATFPIVISSDSVDSQKYCCTTFERAKYHIEDLFISGTDKVVIQDFVYGSEFSFYAVSDGYHAVPLTTSHNFKFSENGDSGILTNGVGAYVPDNSLSRETMLSVFNDVLLKAVSALEANGSPYMGIIGVDAVLTADGVSILNFKPMFSQIDAQAVLNNIDEDLIDLFEACANGFFADEYDDVLVNSDVSVSCFIRPRNNSFVLPEAELIDSSVLKLQNGYVLTSSARTLNRAKQILKDDIENIGVNNIKYRSDIVEC